MSAAKRPGPVSPVSKMTMVSPRGSALAGFTLLEALVALAILGLALVSALTLLSGHSAMDRRLDAHMKALAALEAQHEILRSGAGLPLTAGEHSLNPVLVPDDPVKDFRMWALIDPVEPAGLYKVTLKSRYTVDRSVFTRELEIRLWRPF